MGTTLQPEWLDGSRRQALKYVLKWEIQSLLQRLSDIGEETVLLTADLENGNTCQMGSERGHNFLVSSGLPDVKAKFLSFCSECKDNESESYGEISTENCTARQHNLVDSPSRNKRSHTSNSHRKKAHKRKRDSFTQLKPVQGDSQDFDSVPRDSQNFNSVQGDSWGLKTVSKESQDLKSIPGDCWDSKTVSKESWMMSIPTVPSDSQDLKSVLKDSRDFSSVPWIIDGQSSDDKQGQSLPADGSEKDDRDLGADVVRLKRKKLGPLSKRRKDRSKLKPDCDANSSTDEYDLQEDKSQNKSGNHSSQQEISVNQSNKVSQTGSGRLETFIQSSVSENSDAQSSEEDNSGTNKSTRTKQLHASNSKAHTLSPSDKKFNSKTKSSRRKQKVNQVRLFLESDSENKLNVENQSGLFLETEVGNSLNVELESAGREESEELSQLVEPGNCRTVLTEDGGMMIIPETEIKTEVPDYMSEDSDFLSTIYQRPGSKVFKSASSDEIPTETAILDAAKLGVRRYQCPICMLIVRDRHDLKRHLRTHTKIKPYHCEMCGRNFSRKWDLENHMRRHQEETLKETSAKGPLTMVDLDELKLHFALGKSSGKGGYSGGEDGECKGDNLDELKVKFAFGKSSGKGVYSGGEDGEGKGDNSNMDNDDEEQGEMEQRLFLESERPLVIVKEECMDDTS